MAEPNNPRAQNPGAQNPRDEAERLIAAVLGSASVAAEGLQGFATGSPECCVCPVCKAIAAAREPNADLAERLASGAADLASGLAGVMRAFSKVASGAAGAASGAAPAGESDPWHVATRDAGPGPGRSGASAEVTESPPVADPEE
jgi:hypothetical protein